MKNIRNLEILIKKYGILIITFFLLIIPLLNFDIFVRCDDEIFHMIRIKTLAMEMKSLNIPLYFSGFRINGYGSADFTFYPYATLYLPALLYNISHNIIFSIKIYMMVIVALYVFLMYVSCFEITKNEKIAIIASIIWSLSYYNIWNLYSRCALGECFALAFIPLYVAGIYNLFFNNEKKHYYIIIAMTFIIESHILTFFYTAISTIIFLITILIFKIIKKQKLNTIRILFVDGFFVLLLNIGFLYPMIKTYILENKFYNIKYNVFNVKNIFSAFIKLPFIDGNMAPTTLSSLFSVGPGWVSSQLNSLSVLDGIFFVFILIIIMINLLKSREALLSRLLQNSFCEKETNGDSNWAHTRIMNLYKVPSKTHKEYLNDRNMQIAIWFIIIFIIYLFLYTGILSNIPMLSEIFKMQQFNFRILGRGLVFFYLAFAIVVCKTVKNKNLIMGVLIVILTLNSFCTMGRHIIKSENSIYERHDGEKLVKRGLDITEPLSLLTKEDSIIDVNNDEWILNRYSDYMPINILEKNLISKEDMNKYFSGKIFSDNIIISEESKGYLQTKCKYMIKENVKDGIVVFPFLAINGFRVYVNNKEVKLEKNKYSLVSVDLKRDKTIKKEGAIKVEYKKPFDYMLTFYISLITYVILVVIVIMNKKKVL